MGERKRETKPLPPDLVANLLLESSKHIEEILKEANSLLVNEENAARKEKLSKIRSAALKERANFRLLARQVASGGRNKRHNDAEEEDAAASREENSNETGSEFQKLPGKLAAKFAYELPGWCVHTERPELLHLGHCRYDSADRAFFCDAVATLFQRPDCPDRVVVNLLFLEPRSNVVLKRNQRFTFPIGDVLAALVPLLKSAEFKWTHDSRQVLAATAAEKAAAKEAEMTEAVEGNNDSVNVKIEMEDDESNDFGETFMQTDSQTAAVASTKPDIPPSLPLPPVAKKTITPRTATSAPKLSAEIETTLILEGKRRRKPRVSRDYIREAMEDSDDDEVIVEEDSIHLNLEAFRKAEEERRKDKDFKLPDAKQKRDPTTTETTFHADEIVGKCFHCHEYLQFDQTLTHMTEKHPDDLIRILQCPICGMTPKGPLDVHIRKRHARWSDRLISTFACDSCPRVFRRQEMLDEHVVDVHKPEEKNVNCDECDHKFASTRLRDKHKERIHKPVGENGGEAPSAAKYPDYHKRNSICHLCAKAYRDQTDLEKHMINTHQTKPKEIKCHLCPKAFAVRLNLLNHLKVHSNERSFECPTCKKRFKTRHNLRQHQHSHGPPKFSCQYCGRKFSFKTCRNNHVKAIHGNQPNAIATEMENDNRNEILSGAEEISG